MNRIIQLVLLFLVFFITNNKLTAQIYNNAHNYGNAFSRVSDDSSLHIPFILNKGNILSNLIRPGAISMWQGDSGVYVSTNGISYNKKLAFSTDIPPSYTPDSISGVITSLPSLGDSTPTNDAIGWIKYEFYNTQIPTSTISGGQNIEKISSGANLSYTLSWTAGRQKATANLASIAVAGVTQTFSQPSAPGTISGTQSVSVVRNTNITFSILVTTNDNKTSNASTSFNFYSDKFWGASLTNNVSSIAYTSGSSELALNGSRSKSIFNISISGNSYYIYYAYPASLGLLTSMYVNGMESINAFNLSTINVTNSSGYTESFNIYVSQYQFIHDVTNIIPN